MIGKSVALTVTKDCQHQFFEISKPESGGEYLGNMQDGIPTFNLRYDDGVITMCALCGERRHLHADGRLEVLEKKEV